MKNCVLKCHHVCQRKFSGVGARRQTGAPSKSGWNLSTMMSVFARFAALLDDSERVAAVEQHRSHHSDVEFSEGRRQIVSIAIVHFGFGLQGGVTEPVGILQLLHHDSTRAEYFFQFCIRIRNKVPAVLVCDFDGDHVGAALFHLEC